MAQGAGAEADLRGMKGARVTARYVGVTAGASSPRHRLSWGRLGSPAVGVGEGEQLDLVHEGLLGRDDGRVAHVAVCQLGGHRQARLLALAHLQGTKAIGQ